MYDSYVGWFDGRAVNLRRLPVKTESQKTVDLAGGVENVKKQILTQFEKAQQCGKDIECIHYEMQWALKLSYHLCDIGKGEKTVQLKILNEMANVQTNPLARNWYLQEMNVVRNGQKVIMLRTEIS